VLAFADVVHLFADKFAGLRGWRFAFSSILSSAFESLFFRHSASHSDLYKRDAVIVERDGGFEALSRVEHEDQFLRRGVTDTIKECDYLGRTAGCIYG
jgi:hypothetical protein